MNCAESLQHQTSDGTKFSPSISGSIDGRQPVFDAIVRSMLRLFGTRFASLQLLRDGMIEMPAADGEAGIEKIKERYPRPLDDSTVGGQAILTKQVVQYSPVVGNPGVPEAGQQFARDFGYNSIIAAPMVREDKVIGAILCTQHEPHVFNEKEVTLIKAFADQAVIAIENARLFNELQTRTDDLTESLEQQTATSEVLKVISSAGGELQPVFEAMLENATRLCGAKFGNLYLSEGDNFRTTVMHNVPSAFAEMRMRDPLVRPESGSMLRRVIDTRKTVQIADATKEQAYIDRQSRFVTAVELGGFRSMIAVPMLKDDALIGAIIIYKPEVGYFSEKQIALVENFAAQAVIAIENARLLNELRQRTDDLSESLQQQTATTEILSVISNSLADTQPVFDAIVQSGLKLFPRALVSVALRHGDTVRAAAFADHDPARAEAMRNRFPFPLSREYMHGIAILDAKVVDLPDVENAPEEFAPGRQNFLASGYRAITLMPMLRGGQAIGALGLSRLAPGPLSDKQLAVLRTFASQAVIAIENTRLLNELRQRTDDLSESLEQQTASGEILASISGSMADTKPVFDAIVRNLRRLFGTRFAVVQLLRDGIISMPVADGDPGFEKLMENYPRPLDDATAGGVTMLTKQVHQCAPVVGNPDAPPGAERFAREFKFDSYIFAPMIRDNRVIGAVGVARAEPKLFTDKQVALIKGFADQAVIAIENTRLFEEVQKRTADLQESLEYQTATSEILTVISRSPTDANPVFDVIGERAEKLCDCRRQRRVHG